MEVVMEEMKKVEIKLSTAKDLRLVLKNWICGDKNKMECGMYEAGDPNKELHCECCFVKKLDNQLKRAIKESKE